jgi:hypothetical protein
MFFTATTPLIVSLSDTHVPCVVRIYTSSPAFTYQFFTPPYDVTCLSTISVVGTLYIKFVQITMRRDLYTAISTIFPLPDSVSAPVKLKKNGFHGNHPV